MQPRWIFVLMVLATSARAVPVPAQGWSPPVTARASADSAASVGSASLAASSGVPWNPPGAMSHRHPWEKVVLFPGRIVSLPLSGLGYITRRSMLYLEDTGRVPTGPRAPSAKAYRPVTFQLFALDDGTGLGGAVGLRSPPPKGIVPLLTARYAATIYQYNSTRVGVSRGPVALEYGYDWRPQEQFYGVGSSSSKDSLSDYAMQDEYARGTLRGAWGRASESRERLVVISAWGGPRSRVTRTGRDANQMSYDERFPAIGAATLDRRVGHLIYGGNLSTDWRAGVPHWNRGGRVMVGAERFDAPIQALDARASQEEGAQFTRYSIEAEAGTSIMRDPRTLRVMLRLTDLDVDAGLDHFLPSDLSRLGGRDGLGGYGPGRFHDLDLLLTRLMYVFPLARWFECELHSEWGAVYSDVWRDAKPSTLKSSYGFTMRGRGSADPRAALGFDFSQEGVQLKFMFGIVQ